MNQTITEKLIVYLKEHGMTITTAESCTGGMISSAIVNVPGASDVLNEAYVTYANEAKIRLLGVKPETLENFGAVSAQTAREMAEGVLKAAHADCAIAVTGIAGPDGGTPEKPVGTVFAGFAIGNRTWVREYHFTGSRQEVREKTTQTVLEELYTQLTSFRMA